jgi:GAF domain-containing protein
MLGVAVALFFLSDWITGGLILLAILATSYAFSRTRYHSWGALVLCMGLGVYPYASWFLTRGQDFEGAVMLFVPLSLIIASVLLTRRDFLLLATLCFFLTAAAPFYAPGSVPAVPFIRTLGMLVAASAMLYTLMLYQSSLDSARQAASTAARHEWLQARARLDLRIAELKAEIESRGEILESRAREADVNDARVGHLRSQMDTLTQVSRLVASAHDLDALLPALAEVISLHFGLYHVGIFIMDEAGESAVLRAASSEGGRSMLARNYAVKIGGQDPIGVASATGQVRVVVDAQADPAFLPSPDLPSTCSQIVLPLKDGARIIGALDLQSAAAGGAQDIELPFLTLLAEQVSGAVTNARLLDSARRSLTEAESYSRQYLRQGWNQVVRQQKFLGYRYGPSGTQPLNEPPAPSRAHNGSKTRFPIELRGEVIGELSVQAPRGRSWSQDELDLIKSVAERVALSAENARLFEETSRRAERERMVSEITSRIRSSNDPDEMIKLAVQELKSALGVSRVEVVPQRLSGDSAG